MSDEPLTPTSMELLDAERTRPEEAGAAADRILSRLETSIRALPGGGEPGGDGGGSSPAGGHGAGAVARALGRAKLTAILIGTFAAGIGVGAIGHSQLSPAAPAVFAKPTGDTRASADPEPLPLASVVVATPPPTTTAPAAATTERERTRAATTGSRVDGGKDVALAGEREWIERARMAIARGSPNDALVALDGHAREFPSGRLSEEREALAVHALATQGKTDAARSRARAFRERYPSSVFMPVVNRAAPSAEP